MELHSAYPVRKQVPWRIIEGESLLVDVKAGLLFPLNSVGTRIWQLCDGQRTAAEIVQAILAEFEADEPSVLADTEHFLRALLERGLISLETVATSVPGTDGSAGE
jgi:hypothetical protein